MNQRRENDFSADADIEDLMVSLTGSQSISVSESELGLETAPLQFPHGYAWDVFETEAMLAHEALLKTETRVPWEREDEHFLRGKLEQLRSRFSSAFWGVGDVELQGSSGCTTEQFPLAQRNHPDYELWLDVASQDPKATEEMFVQRCGRMFRFLERKYCCPDILSETYLHLAEEDWRRWRSWQGRANLKTWVEQIAVRLCLQRIRKVRPETEWNEAIELQVSIDGEPAESCSFAHRDAMKAIALLENQRQRTLMEMHVVLGLSLDETAQRMGVKRNHADQIKHMAILKMRASLCGELS